MDKILKLHCNLKLVLYDLRLMILHYDGKLKYNVIREEEGYSLYLGEAVIKYYKTLKALKCGAENLIGPLEVRYNKKIILK